MKYKIYNNNNNNDEDVFFSSSLFWGSPFFFLIFFFRLVSDLPLLMLLLLLLVLLASVEVADVPHVLMEEARHPFQGDVRRLMWVLRRDGVEGVHHVWCHLPFGIRTAMLFRLLRFDCFPLLVDDLEGELDWDSVSSWNRVVDGSLCRIRRGLSEVGGQG